MGAVGEAVADLERAGKRHAVITGVVEGGDAYVAKEIDEWCRAAQVRRRFRYTNIAQIGRPYPGMMDLYIDETNLYNRMGLYTKQFDWEKIWAIADPVTDEAAIRAKAEEILDTFDIEGGATVETVWDMAKYVVAFEEWVKKEDLGMVASHYDGFAKGVAGKLDSMLIPAFSMLIKQGTACAVEGDMKVAMAMSILKTISGTGQLSEMYSIDFNDDICIIGHSGSGKSTLMNIIGCIDKPTSGTYLLDDVEIEKCKDKELSEVRNQKIGFVFQNFNLLPRQSALDNVALPLQYAKVPIKKRKQKAKEMLEMVDLADRVSFKPTQLSGGQKQRVAIARAMVADPKILLADEPTGALDSKSGLQVMELFDTLHKQGVTIIMITHSDEIASYADRVVKIIDGELYEGDAQPVTGGDEHE